MIYAIVLFQYLLKKKYYEIEIAHYNNETKRYIVLDRIKKTMMKYLYIMMNMKIKSTKKILVILKKKREGSLLYHM